MTKAAELSGAGAVYDGDGSLVAGAGPAFSLALIADLAFQAVLHDLDAPGNSMEAGDRMWILPEHPGTPIGAPEHMLADLAATIRAGHKVLVMGHDAEAGNQACEAVGQMVDTPHGTA